MTVILNPNQVTVLLSEEQMAEVVAEVESNIGDVSSVATEIADPGDGQAIAPATNGHVVLGTAGAETRTLSAPDFVGQELMLTADQLVGDCVVTAAAAIDSSGNSIITFDAQGDTIHLRAISIASSPTWRVLANDGCDLAPAE